VLRLVGFFVVAMVALNLLRALPGVGGLFHGFFGFWLAAILVAAAASKGADALLGRRKLRSSIRALGAVDRPHNHGKLGVLLLSHGNARRALEHLERACEGEPEFAEWHYRRGLALLALDRASEAVPPLERALGLSPELGYGAVRLALARAHLKSGSKELALAEIERFESSHGPNPESAYWRGRALSAAGRGDEARRSYREVARLAAEGAHFQRRSHRAWVWRAMLARLV
jgi:hypothetical protein